MWRQISFTVEFQDITHQDILGMIQELGKNLSRTQMELLVAYWWVAWTERNKMIFEGKKLNPLVAVSKTEVVVEAFKRVKEPGKTSVVSKPNELKKQWDPPPSGIYKLNVDATKQAEAQIARLGVVMRDSNSRVVMTVAFRGEVRFSKAEAMEWGIQAAIQAKMHSVIVETDCLEVANLVNNFTGENSKFVIRPTFFFLLCLVN